MSLFSAFYGFLSGLWTVRSVAAQLTNELTEINKRPAPPLIFDSFIHKNQIKLDRFICSLIRRLLFCRHSSPHIYSK